MKKIKYIFLAAMLIALFTTCKKDKKSPPFIDPDEPSTEVMEQLDKETTLTTDLNDIILPNGSRLIDYALVYNYDWLVAHKTMLPAKYQALLEVRKKEINSTATTVVVGPQAIMNNLVLQAQVEAWILTNKTAYVNLLKDSPLQKGGGLAYVYGSKDFTVLKRAESDDGTTACTDLLHGIDCSGMLAYIMTNAGVKIEGNALQQSLKANWEAALKAAGADYKSVKVENFTSAQINLNNAEIKSGDIVYFSQYPIDPVTHLDPETKHRVSHIGIALLDDSGQIKLYQSNGSQSNKCAANYGPNRGPRAIDLGKPLTAAWKFKDYGVIRLVAEISGKWKALIRCQNATTDAIEIQMDFPVVTGGAFKATGSGTDYTGEPINVDLDGNYDPKTNRLSGKLTYTFPTVPNDHRADAFDISLDYDATPYVSLSKVIDNGGCAAAIRLINLQSKEIVNSVGPKKQPNTGNLCSSCSIGNHHLKN